MIHKNLLICSALVMSCLLAATPVWGEKCKTVVIGQTMVGSLAFGPENCDGYDGCATSQIKGTFNGTLTESFYNSDVAHLVDLTWAYTNHGLIETPHGKLILVERSIADYAASDGFAVHINVVDGTGGYEGAYGWMAYFGNFAGTYSKWGGEVCWGDEE